MGITEGVFNGTHEQNFWRSGKNEDLYAYSSKDFCSIGKITFLSQPISLVSSQNIEGHFAVTSSILRGCRAIGQDFNYNPKSLTEVGDHIFILCNPQALLQAITLKREGRIKTLIVGPNIFGRPAEGNGILACPEIDWYLPPSEWIREWLCQEDIRLKEKMVIWYAGVDPTYWAPKNINKKNNKTVLIYAKHYSQDLYLEVKKLVQAQGWRVKIIKYGSYSIEQYKNILQQCRAAIFLSYSESQGIALAECWAMDVPTLVWEKGEILLYGKFVSSSGAPYLTNYTGRSWKTLSELDYLLKNFDEISQSFSPRKWILDYMTDSVSMYLLQDIIKNTFIKN